MKGDLQENMKSHTCLALGHSHMIWNSLFSLDHIFEIDLFELSYLSSFIALVIRLSLWESQREDLIL